MSHTGFCLRVCVPPRDCGSIRSRRVQSAISVCEGRAPLCVGFTRSRCLWDTRWLASRHVWPPAWDGFPSCETNYGAIGREQVVVCVRRFWCVASAEEWSQLRLRVVVGESCAQKLPPRCECPRRIDRGRRCACLRAVVRSLASIVCSAVAATSNSRSKDFKAGGVFRSEHGGDVSCPQLHGFCDSSVGLVFGCPGVSACHVGPATNHCVHGQNTSMEACVLCESKSCTRFALFMFSHHCNTAPRAFFPHLVFRALAHNSFSGLPARLWHASVSSSLSLPTL